MAEKRSAQVEALQIALETEEKGYRFYRTAAKSTEDPAGRSVFEQLARDEIEHMGVLATLYASLNNDEPWMTYEDALEKFGRTPADHIIYPDEPEGTREHFNDMKALEEALEFERKAVRFYTEKAAEADEADARSFYEKLIEIEEGHVKIIQAEIDSLSGAGVWLDYQEISLEH